MKKLLFALVLCAVALTTMAQVPKYEVRAVWLTTLNSLDWPSTKATNSQSIERQQQQFCAILDQLRQSNVNTVLLQTRVRATTIYPSRYEPFDGCLTGKPGRDPGYDVLRFAIDECHRRGMELHAWVVAIPVGKWNAIGCKQLRERYGSLIRKIGDEGYMNPEMSQTSEHIAKICREIAENYDVDGIHLDYIRYPENWKQTQSKSRGRELFDENWRRNDMIRYGHFEDEYGFHRKGFPTARFDKECRIFPIPQSVLNKNTSWKQNAGY